MTDDNAWDALTTVDRLEALLPTKLYAGSKDWTSSDLVGRVEWLLAMYENVKIDRDQLVIILADVSSSSATSKAKQ